MVGWRLPVPTSERVLFAAVTAPHVLWRVVALQQEQSIFMRTYLYESSTGVYTAGLLGVVRGIRVCNVQSFLFGCGLRGLGSLNCNSAAAWRG